MVALFSFNLGSLVCVSRQKNGDLAFVKAKVPFDECGTHLRIRRNDRALQCISPRYIKGYAMAPLSRYLLGLAAAATVIFVGSLTFSDWKPALSVAESETPQWKVERLARDPATPVLSAASLSPIYPASPGKELLARAVVVVAQPTKRHEWSSAAKTAVTSTPVTLATNKLPRKFINLSNQDKVSQRLSYAPEPPPARIELVSFGHGLY
jgi:hypothetical protein